MIKNKENYNILKSSLINTILGNMLVIADDKKLYLLEFIDQPGLGHEIKTLKLKLKASIISGNNYPIKSIKSELQAYFNGTLTKFKTPIYLLGSHFQKLVWEELKCIPYGKILTYANQAKAIGKSTAYRAVANANGANKLAIVIPCHRVINSNSKLGGYKGGIIRKKWLIEHESSINLKKL